MIYPRTYINMTIVLKIEEFVLSLSSVVIEVMRSLQEDNDLIQSGMFGKDVKVKVRGMRTGSALFKACCPVTPPQRKNTTVRGSDLETDLARAAKKNRTSETFI